MLSIIIGRRNFLSFLTSYVLLASASKPALSDYIPPHPNPANFRSGDFVWPAKAGAFIPYASSDSTDKERAIETWQREKHSFIEHARTSADAKLINAAENLETLNFEDFEQRYFNDTEPGRFIPYSSGLPEVGHMALIEVDENNTAWVIEADPGDNYQLEALFRRSPNGVRRTQYSRWNGDLEENSLIWHGRLENITEDNGHRIIEIAKTFLGRDYGFWSFDLSDEGSFYCSKLVWLSTWKAIGVSLDGNTEVKRTFWVTPKQLLKSDKVILLHNPDSYGIR